MIPAPPAKRLLLALDVAKMSIWDSVIPDRKIRDSKIYWRGGGLALLGLAPARAIQQFADFLHFVHPDDRPSVMQAMQEAVDRQGGYDIEYRVVWPDGSIRWLAARAEILFSGKGRSAHSLGLIWDISARKQAELELARQKELAEVTLSSIGDGVITTDARGTVQYLNRVAEQVSGWSNGDLAPGIAIDRLFKLVNEETGEEIENIAVKCLRLQQTIGLTVHGQLVAKSGKRIPIEDSAAPIRAANGDILGAVIVFRDVSHERALKRELSWHAAHDPLTGLINRREFESRVVNALAGAKAEGHAHALMFLDLDQFKVVNDTCGHKAGDLLLKVLANALYSRMREADILARLGGDEFGALLLNCPLGQAYQLADKLRQAVKSFRFAWEGRTFEIGVSIGMVAINEDSKSLSELLSAADQACYVAKELGRNRVHLYQETDMMVAKRRRDTLWVSRLSEAFQLRRFVLYTQPIVSLNGDAADHLEVLIRIISNDGELILPGAFIPAAERYDVMVPIDRWVIETVCSWMREGRISEKRADDAAAEPAQAEAVYSINLSGASINDGSTGDFIARMFEQYQVDAGRICFEVTETAAIGNLDTASALMQKIKKLGCRFALDDFGSGFSSFSYLKMLPVDYLKIDGTFVRDINVNEVNHALVSAINQVGHVMGMKTIAEYVESSAILETVHGLGIDYAQGHAIGKIEPLIAMPSQAV